MQTLPAAEYGAVDFPMRPAAASAILSSNFKHRCRWNASRDFSYPVEYYFAHLYLCIALLSYSGLRSLGSVTSRGGHSQTASPQLMSRVGLHDIIPARTGRDGVEGRELVNASFLLVRTECNRVWRFVCWWRYFVWDEGKKKNRKLRWWVGLGGEVEVAV